MSTTNAQLQALTRGKGNAGTVVLQTNGGAVSLDNSVISTVESGGEGNAGSIGIEAKTISLTNNAQLQAQTRGKGDAGTVVLQTNGGAVSLDNSVIFSTVESGGNGNAGNIGIEAKTISLTNNAQLQTQTRDKGDAGTVVLQTNGGTVSLDNSKIFSNVESGGEGKPGNIGIEAKTISLDNSKIFSNVESGGKGDAVSIIKILTGTLSMSNGSELQTLLQGPNGKLPGAIGKAGIVEIQATNAVSLSNSRITSTIEQGAISTGGNTFAGNLFNLLQGQSDQQPFGFIVINTGELTLVDSLLNASTSGQGNAGGILVRAKDNVRLSNGSLFKGSKITTQTNGIGNAGGILVWADGDITLTGNNSGIFSTAEKINVEAGIPYFGGGIITLGKNIFITDGSKVEVDNQRQGNAGNIYIQARSVRLDRGEITARTASADGGDITLTLRDLLLLRHDSQISTTAGQNGRGGDITITNLSKPFPFIVAVREENSDIIASATNGPGGKININTSGVYNMRRLNDNSDPRKLLTNDITAVSQQGGPQLDGRITINNPDVDPSNGLVSLPVDVFDPSNQIAQGCAAFDEATASDFKLTGRGGLPASPDETLSSDAVWEDTRLRTATAQRLDSKTTATKPKSESDTVKITPATGWVFNSKGEVTLISQTPNATVENLAASSQSCRVR